MAVMSVKRGTQSFSKAEQTSNMKNDQVNAANAADFQKAFGEQKVGDVANKLTDPNWVDPAKKMRVAGNNQLDKDAFLKLMLAQMKHQDPTNPMQSHEMAAQLAQFTSLEQLNNINSTLEAMKTQSSPTTNFQALGFIGKRVSGDSSKVTRVAGDTKHAFNFELLGDAAKVNIAVKDAGGNTVRKLEFANLKKGANSVEWNGLMEDGLPTRPGEYKLSVEAQSSNGAKVYSKTSFEGRITGLNYTAEGPVLMVGDQSIKLSDVKKIEEAGPESIVPTIPLKAGSGTPPGQAKNATDGAAAMAAAITNSAQMKSVAMPLPTAAVAAPLKAVNATATAPVTNESANVNAEASEFVPPAEEEDLSGNIDSVPMARGLLEQVVKAQGS